MSPSDRTADANLPLLDRLIDAALTAGREIMAVYATDFAVNAKADASLVTAADERAEAAILAALAIAAPDVPVVSEEEACAGRLPEVGARFFLVDPLDGTREFVARNGEFTVNIALIEDGVPVCGVVYAPALGRLYAGSGDGAVAADIAEYAPGAMRPIAVRPAPTAGLTAVASRSHRSGETDAFLTRLPVVACVSAGSSLKFCLVAAGEADLYPRLSPTMQWDTAAGDAVLRAAGGRVVTLAGDPLPYGPNGRGIDAFRNPHFVALGDVRLP